jgi:hypothetical protein
VEHLSQVGWIMAFGWLIARAFISGGAGVFGCVNSYAFALLLSTPAAIVGGRSALRLLKFGRSRFELATLPGTLGGDLAGTLVANRRLMEVPQLIAILRCDRMTSYGSGKSRSIWTEHVWCGERTLTGPFTLDGERTRVPIRFPIPLKARATDESNSDATVRWRLSVMGPVGVTSYYAEFDVPVFDLGAQGHAADADAHARAAKEAALAASVGEALRGAGPGRDWGRWKGFVIPAALVALAVLQRLLAVASHGRGWASWPGVAEAMSVRTLLLAEIVGVLTLVWCSSRPATGEDTSVWGVFCLPLALTGLPAVASAWLVSGRAVASTAEELGFGVIVAITAVAGWFVGLGYGSVVSDLASRGATLRYLVGPIFFALLASVLGAGFALGVEVRRPGESGASRAILTDPFREACRALDIAGMHPRTTTSKRPPPV